MGVLKSTPILYDALHVATLYFLIFLMEFVFLIVQQFLL